MKTSTNFLRLCAAAAAMAVLCPAPSRASIPATPSKDAAAASYGPADKAVTWTYQSWQDPQTRAINWDGVEKDASLIQQAGISWVRLSLKFGDNLANTDRLVDIAKAHSIRIDFLIGKGVPHRNYGSPAEEAFQQEWLAMAVARYKSQVNVWEVGNEENLGSYWDQVQPDGVKDVKTAVAQYIKYLASSYRTIKEVDPRATVLMGGLSEWKVEPWLDAFRAQGGGAYTDAFAVHPYAGSPAGVVKRLNQILALVRTDPLLASKPVWITEIGFMTESTWRNNPGYVGTEDNKAADLSDVMQRLRADGITTPIFWYCLHEAGPRSKGYGLTVIDSVPDAEVTMLPAYDAYRRLWSKTSSLQPISTDQERVTHGSGD